MSVTRFCSYCNYSWYLRNIILASLEGLRITLSHHLQRSNRVISVTDLRVASSKLLFVQVVMISFHNVIQVFVVTLDGYPYSLDFGDHLLVR